jgi:HAE1 family hydrophobic/amphiphilic exporter-1
MNIAKFSIKRPIFIASIVSIILFTGFMSLSRLGVDLFPDVSFPYIVVYTIYPGSAPEEIENLISKPMEDEVSSIAGLNSVTSYNKESISTVVAKFNLGIDVKYAEQQVKDKIARLRRNLPDGIEEPLVLRYDPADMSIIRIALSGDLLPSDLYDLAKEEIKAYFEQVNNVASVQIIGGRRREIQVELDRRKMNELKIPAVLVANQLKNSGINVPVGRFEQGANETVFRTMGQFKSLKQIEDTIIYFAGDPGNGITLKSLAKITDGAEEATTMGFLYAPIDDTSKSKDGFYTKFKNFFSTSKKKNIDVKRTHQPALFMDIFKQSGSNTVDVANGVISRINDLNEKLKGRKGSPRLTLVYDNSLFIKMNIEDVAVTIIIGIILAIIVVYLFLGNVRSTIITGIALPNSLLGAFILMYVMGFTINMMTLLALSLTIGLLVDDAIVVRENIFRKLESGLNPLKSAEIGTTEVMLAVIATTLTIVAVFFPIGFLSGIVGQFFKQFGFTVVFAMMISLFDALTVAPLLSAYFAGKADSNPNVIIRKFELFQRWIENQYGKIMRIAIDLPLAVIAATIILFIASLASLGKVKKTFMPTNEWGEFIVQIEMPAGTSLDGTKEVTQKIEQRLMKLPELNKLSTTIGTKDLESNKASIGVSLVPANKRERVTSVIKEELRKMLARDFLYANAKVNDYVLLGMPYPFYLNIICEDLKVLEDYSNKLLPMIKDVKELTDVGTSFQIGKPEFQVQLDTKAMQNVGVLPAIAGAELRYQIAGVVAGKLHDKGLEYDVRMRLRPEQRDLRASYTETRVPNVQYKMIPLPAISTGVTKAGPSMIIRENRARVVQIYANLVPGGALASATEQVRQIIVKKAPLPKGVSYAFIGQSEDFKEMVENIILALILAIVLIYFILASLYESFITPFTILVALPPALSGAFLALAITGEMLNIFSMIGLIMLIGLVTKNSILLVDFALEGVRGGMSRKEAIYRAGMVRLRPILMTTFAMMAGTLPLALGIGEVSKMRSSMGVAIIGGLILSTFMTLVVVPAIFEFIDSFREWFERKFRPQDMRDWDINGSHKMAEDLEAVHPAAYEKKLKAAVRKKKAR